MWQGQLWGFFTPNMKCLARLRGSSQSYIKNPHNKRIHATSHNVETSHVLCKWTLKGHFTHVHRTYHTYEWVMSSLKHLQIMIVLYQHRCWSACHTRSAAEILLPECGKRSVLEHYTCVTNVHTRMLCTYTSEFTLRGAEARKRLEDICSGSSDGARLPRLCVCV